MPSLPPDITEANPPTAPRKSYRTLRPAPKIAETQQTLATTSQRRTVSRPATRTPEASQRQLQPEQDEDAGPDRRMEVPGTVKQLLGPTGPNEVANLTALLVRWMEKTERDRTEAKQALDRLAKEHAIQIEALRNQFTQQVEAPRTETRAMAERLETQLAKIQTIPSGSPTYADIARTPPNSEPSNIQTISGGTIHSTVTDTLYCTIDTSRVEETAKDRVTPGQIRQAIESEMRTTENRVNWRCVAVVKEARNAGRIRITCRDEAELQAVRDAAHRTAANGSRVLRDQLYPIRVDNANRTAVLTEEGEVRPGVTETLGTENGVQVAKVSWLSRKDVPKAYGSMVVYMTRNSDAARLLSDQYFHINGESAYTKPFERRDRPMQCYKCQQIGHKAFACAKQQGCARCAGEGHHHNECQATIPKCVPCGGPHESFSRNCRVVYPGRHA